MDLVRSVWVEGPVHDHCGHSLITRELPVNVFHGHQVVKSIEVHIYRWCTVEVLLFRNQRREL